MLQETDASFPTKLAEYVNDITYDLLHVVDFPPELTATFEKITQLFNTTAGPFALIEREGRSATNFYAKCFNDVRLAICATWYNWQIFETLCKALETKIEEGMKAHTVQFSLEMNIGVSGQKLCFEYEHFMFHQRATVDRIAFFLSGFFKGSAQDNIRDLRTRLVRELASRPSDPKHRYALAIDSVVSKHQHFIDSVHGSTRAQTERDIFSHKNFIPFANPYVQITPPRSATVVFQATLNGRSTVSESARTILQQRYNQVAAFTKEMLDAFFDA